MSRSKKFTNRKQSSTPQSKTPKSKTGATTFQAKPNLQPARRIKKNDEPATIPASEPMKDAAVEELKNSQTQVVAAPQPAVSDTSASPNEHLPPPKIKEEKAPEVVAAQPIDSPVSPAEAPPIHLPPSVKKLQRRRTGKKFMTGLVLIALVAIAGVAGNAWFSSDASAENQKLIADVSKRALVPADETPAITTVINENQIDQEFLRGTKKGDKVLLYFQAGRAVVYRPSSGHIVNMGPIETPTPRVFLRNGSAPADVNAVISKLKGSTDFILTSRDDAKSKSYQKTIVIDVTGARPDVAARLAQTLQATVGTLPAGESRPDADLLVIVGADQTARP